MKSCKKDFDVLKIKPLALRYAADEE